MQLIFEDAAAMHLTQFVEVTEAQMHELQRELAANENGYWLLGMKEWNILAIALDQVPGGYDLQFKLENR